jgi:hypothetical protein
MALRVFEGKIKAYGVCPVKLPGAKGCYDAAALPRDAFPDVLGRTHRIKR